MSKTHDHPAKDARLVIGAVIIKRKLCLSDEESNQQIQENPSHQYFVGLAGYQRQAPFASSLMVEIRKRMGQSVCDVFHREIINTVLITKAKRKPMPGSQSEIRQGNASDANAREVGKRAALLAWREGERGASVIKIKRKIMAANLFDLAGKTALITGSSKGIGKAIAAEMARHGAKMVISSRKLDFCQAIAETINQEFNDTGGEAISIAANVGYKDHLQPLADPHGVAGNGINLTVLSCALQEQSRRIAE